MYFEIIVIMYSSSGMKTFKSKTGMNCCWELGIIYVLKLVTRIKINKNVTIYLFSLRNHEINTLKYRHCFLWIDVV